MPARVFHNHTGQAEQIDKDFRAQLGRNGEANRADGNWDFGCHHFNVKRVTRKRIRRWMSKARRRHSKRTARNELTKMFEQKD